MEEEACVRRLEHLWALTQACAAAAPALSRFYAAEIVALSREARIPLAAAVRSRLCSRCAAPFAPGVNARVRLLPLRKLSSHQRNQIVRHVDEARQAGEDSGKSKPRNAIVTSCLVCGACSAWPGAARDARAAAAKASDALSASAVATPAPAPPSSSSSAKASPLPSPPLARAAPAPAKKPAAAAPIAPTAKRRRTQQRRSLETMLAGSGAREGGDAPALRLEAFLDAV